MKTVEIRNQLTLELITILQPTETIPYLMGPLAYSPDGRSIACVSDTAIIIWDIQTGGVAEEIERSAKSISLVWSPDGQMLCTINQKDRVTFTVHTHEISSRTTLSPGTLQSGDKPYLWTDDNSFWVMTTAQHDTIDIFKVGSTLTRIRSLDFPPSQRFEAKIGSFSPTTHRISISDGRTLRIFDIQNSRNLLNAEGSFFSHCFSSDGSLFAASQQTDVRIWKYSARISSWYISQRGFSFLGLSQSQLSPTSSSILRHSFDILQVSRLRKIPAIFESRSQQYVGLSRSGTRAVTAHKMERVVTIIDLVGQTPPQYIDMGVEIQGLVVTGNVLIVEGSGEVIGWLLTDEGLVDGVIGDRRVYRSDMIWSIPVQEPSGDSCELSVQGHVGVIGPRGGTERAYHIETGEVLHPTQVRVKDRWYRLRLDEALRGRDYLRFHNMSQRNTPPEDSWQTSEDTLREGWVKDPDGKHRLWVPVEWRTDWDPADWRHDVTTQFSRSGDRDKPILIKF